MLTALSIKAEITEYTAHVVLLTPSRKLDSRGLERCFAGAESEVAQMVKTTGLATNAGGVEPEKPIGDVIDRWKAEQSSSWNPRFALPLAFVSVFCDLDEFHGQPPISCTSPERKTICSHHFPARHLRLSLGR